MNKFDLGTVLKTGWELFLKDPALLILATILAFVLSLTIVLAPLAMAGMTLLVLKLARGERPQIGEFFEPFADFVRYFLGGLVVLAGGLVSWLAWWASPGLGFVAAVVLTSLLLFLFPLMIDRRQQPLEAFQECVAYWKTEWAMTGLLALVIAVLDFLGSLPFGLGLLLTWPLTVGFVVAAYEQAYGSGEAAEVVSPPEE